MTDKMRRVAEKLEFSIFKRDEVTVPETKVMPYVLAFPDNAHELWYPGPDYENDLDDYRVFDWVDSNPGIIGPILETDWWRDGGYYLWFSKHSQKWYISDRRRMDIIAANKSLIIAIIEAVLA